MLTDHRPLVGIENKDLDSTKNLRVIRLWKDLLGYDFKTEYIQGEKNSLADYLSRNPLEGMDAPYFPRLLRPLLFQTRGSANMVRGGHVVYLALLELAQEAKRTRNILIISS